MIEGRYSIHTRRQTAVSGNCAFEKELHFLSSECLATGETSGLTDKQQEKRQRNTYNNNNNKYK
jgi:hypothetical protein